MANYYLDGNGNPFVQGAMVGFNLIDQAIARRNAIAQEKRRLDLVEEERDYQRERDRLTDFEKQRAQGTQAINRAFAEFGEDTTKWTPEQRSHMAGLVRRADPTRYASVDDNIAIQEAPNLAREGGEFLATEAIRRRREGEVAAGLEEKAKLNNELLEAAENGPVAPLGSPERGAAISRTSTPRGIANNNPVNLIASNEAWQGKVGNDGKFEVFQTPEAGIRAGAINLITGAEKYGANTLRSAITRHAPPGQNDTAAYIAAVSKRLGLDPDAPLNFRDPRVNAAVIDAIIRHENSGQQPYSPEVIGSAVQAAIGPKSAPGPSVGNPQNPAQGTGSGVVRPLSSQSLYGTTVPREPPLVKFVKNFAENRKESDRDFAHQAAISALDPNDPAGNIFRNKPVLYLSSYLDGVRDRIKYSANRDALDKLMFTGIAAELSKMAATMYVASDESNPSSNSGQVQTQARIASRRYKELITQFNDLKKARTADAVDSMLSGSTTPGAKAGTTGQRAMDEAVSGNIKATPDEVRAGQRTVEQWAGKQFRRLTPDQIKRAARLVAIGVASPEEFNQLMTTGSFVAPEKPALVNLGNGLVGTWDSKYGFRVIDHSAEYARAERAGKGADKEIDTQIRLRANEQWNRGLGYLAAVYKAEKIDNDITPHEHMSRLMQLMERNAPEIERRKGYRLTYNGQFTTAFLSEGQFGDILDTYGRFSNEELDAFFKDGKGFVDYMSAPDAAPGVDMSGWSVERAD